jgi:hypothetical protein
LLTPFLPVPLLAARQLGLAYKLLIYGDSRLDQSFVLKELYLSGAKIESIR